MSKEAHHPKYSNEDITRLIKSWIHDKEDRQMLYWHLVDGDTIQEIADKTGKDRKTIWTHLKDGKKELFSHIPYEENDR